MMTLKQSFTILVMKDFGIAYGKCLQDAGM